MLSDAWNDLSDEEPIQRLHREQEGLYSAVAGQGWTKVCRWASCFEPGQWWMKEKGLTWCNGRRVLWVVTKEQLPAIYAAKSICEGLGVKCGWSIGSAARSLLKYCGTPQHPYKSSLGLLSDIPYGYRDCTPGIYPDSTMWDVKSYYFSLLSRLPTWRVTLEGTGSLRWHRDEPGESERRGKVLLAVAGHKLLRNALVGCMVGRSRGMSYFHRGERRSHRGGPGLFRGAGLLVIRSAYEVTQAASIETESKLSNVDCVLTQGGLYPTAWSDLGLTVEERYHGDAEVCAPVIYRVGHAVTEYYRRGSRFQDAILKPEIPDRSYHRLWLRAAA